jgi:hypothetical protein
MHDVSAFMKTFKQRFSVWYNRTHNRYGTLWAERFKSVLVEDDSYSLANIAAYIDLNPVRAGLVTDPNDYRFCGYAEAVGGQNPAIREGLCSVMERWGWSQAQREYRMILFGKGSTAKADGAASGKIEWEDAAKVLSEGGQLPLSTALRCRIRYFTDGAVLGSKDYVAAVLKSRAQGTEGPIKDPVAVPGSDWQGLFALRRLRRKPFGPA